MNRDCILLKKQISSGYWPGFTMAMYPNQFAYKKMHVNLREIWKDCKEVNLYFHIPFCKSICPFCGFFTVAKPKDEYIKKYIDKLCNQIRFYSDTFEQKVLIKSICFGGGTPNAIDVESYQQIFDTLRECNFEFDKDLEPSMEVSPELLEENYVKRLYEIGIRRLSLGVQTLDFNLRNKIHRLNNYNYYELLNMIRKNGMNINIDIMYGLANQTIDMVVDTLEKLLEIMPETISLYPLAGKGNSILNKETSISKYDYFRACRKLLENNNYYCESNIKFVKKNQKSTHQQKIYEYQGVPTMGLGCAARSYNYYVHYSVEQSFDSKNRMKMLDDYIEKDFEDFEWFGVTIDELERKSRYGVYGFFMGTVDLDKYNKLFNSDFEEDFKDALDALYFNNLIIKEGNTIKLNYEGRVYTDLVCTRFWSSKNKELYEMERRNGNE